MNDNDAAGGGNNTDWFLTEASGFIGARAHHDKLIGRIAQRMRRKARPEQLISNSIFGLARHAAMGDLCRPRLCGEARLRRVAHPKRPALSDPTLIDKRLEFEGRGEGGDVTFEPVHRAELLVVVKIEDHRLPQ